MKKMKCVFVSCFNNYEARIKPVEDFFKSKGYDCNFITSDFDHTKKVQYKAERDDSIQIKTIKYYKNFSIKRFISHFLFSIRAYQETKKLKPDLIYVMIPPNFLAVFFSRYKKRNETKLVFDIFDMWPETFPSMKIKNVFKIPFKLWKSLRDSNLKEADLVITECDLYQNYISDAVKGIKMKTIYLSKEEKDRKDQLIMLDENRIHLCYLGSINNIIDIKKIRNLVGKVNDRIGVTVHIIGDGENKNKLIEELENTGAKVEYYGKIFDFERKRKIMDKCHFGLNVMKDSVCVGLTMKSVDYFQANLPILNNIKGDTSRIVEENKVGFNIENNLDELVDLIVSLNTDQLLEIRENVAATFKELFSTKAVNSNLEYIYNELRMEEVKYFDSNISKY